MRHLQSILRFAFAAALAFCACLPMTFAQAPRTFSYQGTLTDLVQTPFPDSTYLLTFALYDSPSGGAFLWQESHNVSTVGGIFDVNLGTVTPLAMQFDKQMWLGITHVGNAEMAPRTPLVSTPYSLFSESAGTALALSPNATGAVLSLNGLSGNLTLQGGGKTSVSQNGSTILITSLGGIDRIDPADGSLTVGNPTGPSVALSVTDGGITTGKLTDGAITTAKLADYAVTTLKLSDGSVTTSKIADDAVTTVKVLNGAISTSKLSSTGANTGQALTFDGTNIVWGSPSLSGAAGGDLTGNYPNPSIMPGVITSIKLADGAITTGKLADGAVISSKVNDGAITTAKLSTAGAVNGQVLTYNGTSVVWGTSVPSGAAGGDLTGNYPNPSISLNAITTAKIADGAVTMAKLSDAAVTMDKIADAQVTAVKINPIGATSGQALTYNGTNVVWGSPSPSGAASGDLTGSYPNPTIVSNAVTTAKIADSAITTAKVNDGAITTAKVNDGAITTAKVNTTGATSGQALTFNGTNVVWGSPSPSGAASGDLTGNYPNPSIAVNAVTTAKIADGSVTTSKVNDGAITTAKVNTTGATSGQALTFNGTTVVWGSPSPSGAASGDLTGSYPNPSIAVNAVTTAKIADGSITNSKVNTTGATSGQALTFNGTNVVWGSPSPSGAASGDLTGNYPNPSIATNAVTTAKIADNSVTTAKVNDGAITTSKVNTAGATSGQELTFNGTNVVWGSPSPSGAASGDLTGSYPNPSIAVNAVTTAKIADGSITNSKVNTTGATSGQALTFNGTNVVWGSPSPSGAASGDLTGSYPNPSIATNAVTTAKIADNSVTTSKVNDGAITTAKVNTTGATSGQALTFNGTNVVWGSPSPSGAASGDLTGSYPNPSIATNAVTTAKIADNSVTTAKVNDGAITTAKVNTTGATSGQALTFNGTNVVWGSPSPSGAASGDLTGSYPNPSIASNAITTAKIVDGAVTTAKVNTTGATSGQALTFNGTNVVWGSPSPSGAASGDLTGSYPNPSIASNSITTAKIADGSITNTKVNTTGATSGQALTFNGTNVVWGSPSPSGAASGDLTGNYPNPSVAVNAITTAKIADAAVTTVKVNDGAITTAKVNTTGATSGQALTFNGTNVIWGSPSPSGAASGDLTGSYPNPSIASNAVTTAKIADNSVTTAKVNDGSITTAKVNTTGATSGQALTFNGTNVVWGSPSPSGAASGDLTGSYPNPSIATNAVTTAKIADGAVTTVKVNDGAITTAKVNTTGATSGQALTFNGTNVVWGSPSPSGAASGDLTGNYPNPSVAANAITTAKIADASVTTAKVNDGAITTSKSKYERRYIGSSAHLQRNECCVGSPSPSGAASGDLTGNYPNPSVAANAITTAKIADGSVTTAKVNDGAITTAKVNTTGATSGQALTFNGTNVVWGSPSPSGAASGDLTGSYPNPSIATNAVTTAKIADGAVTTVKVNDGAITTAKVNTTGATSGQALTFNGTNVVWGSPSPSGAASGDLTGNYPNPGVAANAITTAKIADASVTTAKVNDGAITTSKVNTSGATSGQALTFNGTNVVWGSPSPSGAASGDLTGNYPNPSVAANAITTAKIADGSVTTAKVNDGAITTAKVNTTGATSGQALTFNGTNVVWGSPSPSGAASGDLTGNYPNPSVAANAITTTKIADASVTTAKVNDGAITTSKVNTTGATSGQALTFNGTNVVWGSPSPSGAASGDLTGNYPNPSVAANAITTAKIADASVTTAKVNDGAITTAKVNTTGAANGQALTFNGTNVVWGSPSPSGAASGDLTGNYPNPSVAANAITTAKIADAAVTTSKVNTTGATSGQALTFNGTNVVWGSPSVSGAASGDLTGNYPNPSVAANAITTAKIADGSVTTAKVNDGAITTAKVNTTGATLGQALTFDGANVVWGSPNVSGTASGDLTGNYPNPSVASNTITTSKIVDANVTSAKLADGAVTNAKINSSGASAGQALTYNGTSVAWGNPSPSGAAGGDLSGTYPNPTVAKMQGRMIATTAPTSGQALVWNQTLSQWEPSTPSGGDVTGPALAVDNAIARYDLTTGKSIQNSALLIDDYTASPQANTTLRADDGATANISLVLSAKGTGALTSGKPDGTVSGGNSRGQNAVDWQMSRSANTQIASGNYTVISGGTNNTASGIHSAVGGGQGNTVSTNYSTISGGNGNTITTGLNSTIAGGNNNLVTGDHAVVSGGNSNKSTSFAASVGGGYLNSAQSNYSSIPGGYGLRFSSGGADFGYNAWANSYQDSATISAAQTAYFGNVDLWLGNTRNQASKLKFFTAQATGGQFPLASTYFTAFQAGVQTADITYTLPTAAATSNGQVLSSTTGGVLSWVTASAGNVVGPATATDNAITRYDATTGKLIQNSAIIIDDFTTTTQNNVTLRADDGATGNIDLVLSPKGTGALVASKPGGGADARGNVAVDWQMSRSVSTQVASGDYSTISGGRQNTAASYTATVAGGILNSVTAGNYGVVSGGNGNTVSGSASNIGGGSTNTNSGTNSVIAGGVSNVNAGNYSTIAGGFTNNVSNSYSTVGGGSTNTASSNQATVSGGLNNIASGSSSTIGGGSANTASQQYATIGGGNANQATSGNATVSGGVTNIASGNSSTISGGNSNSTAGDYSTILGGRGLTFGTNADRSVGFHANNSGGSLPMTIDVADVAVFGNTNLWLANNDNSASELRFFEAYNTSGSFPNTANYTAFKAGVQTADITYTLPTAAATSNGQVLSSTTGGVLSWVTASAGNVVGPASATDNAITRYDATTGKLIQNSALIIDDFASTVQGYVTLRADDGSTGNIALVLQPKGNGALTAGKPDGTSGDARGQNAVDWQISRSTSTQVASGDFSTIGGGRQNTAAAYTSTVSGGILNSITAGNYCVISGGNSNAISGSTSTIGGGSTNTITSTNGVIAGGVSNSISGSYATIGGGFNNNANSQYSTVSGGSTNTASGTNTTVGGGFTNTASGSTSTISGGSGNSVSGVNSTIGGGVTNIIECNYSVIPGGYGMRFGTSATNSFGYNGRSGSTDSAYVNSSNTAYFGNVDLWLGNTRNQASALRFYTAQAADGTFPDVGTYYSSFKAGVQTGNLTYTLPIVAPTNGQVLSSTSAGVMSWTSVSGGDVVGPASATDNAISRFDAATGKLIQNSAITIDDYTTTTQNNVTLRADDGSTSNIDLVLKPKGTGSLSSSKPDGTATGGDARGTNAVDWQGTRSVSTQVASGASSTIGGGNQNTASNGNTTVGGGFGNTASGNTSTVAGGNTNTASASYSTISGGIGNAVSGMYGTVSGGRANTASGVGAYIGGGGDNGIFISGNTASGVVSAVVGGYTNSTAGDYSTILGGRGLTLGANANRSIGFHSNNSGGTLPMTIDVADVAVFGNSNLWLANNNNTPSELRFFEAYNTSGAFPNTANYTAFKAGTQTVDITYTLPTAAPTTDGQVLASTTAGVMSWSSVSGGDVVGPTSATDNAISRYDSTTGKLIQNSAIVVDDYTTSTQNNVTLKADDGATSDISLVLSPKGTGALTANKPDGTASGGDVRGASAVDWQISRSNSSQVASGDNSTIGGGLNNSASGTNATVSGGKTNTASGNSATISGGNTNSASNFYSTVSGGNSNSASAYSATIGGGLRNSAEFSYGTIPGGYGMRLGASAEGSFGFNGFSTYNDSAYVNTARTAYFGNVDLWLGNTRNQASALRFYTAQAADGTFPDVGTYYSSFKAGTQSANISYTLPTDAPTSNGQVLASTTAGVMSWTSVGSGDVTGPSSATDNAISRFDATTGKLIQNSAITIDDYTTSTQNNVTLRADDGSTTDISLVLMPKGAGALMADKSDGATSGGNARGLNAVDFQMSRSTSSQVASGSYSTIPGGQNNVASGNTSFAGGFGNSATGNYSVAVGGQSNNATGDHAVLVGGVINSSDGYVSSVGGGYRNFAKSNYSTIPGGYGLTFDVGTSCFGYNGWSSSYNDSARISSANIAYLGNVDLWLGNTRNQASKLKFFSAQATSGAFPTASTHFTSFQAGVQSADITYTLPTDAPVSDGQVLASTTGGTMSWTSAGSGDVVGPGAATDNAISRFDATTGKLIQNSAIVVDDYTTSTQNNVTLRADDGSTSNIDLVVSPKGTGALSANKPDGATSGGDARGANAVDFQMTRNASTQVASGGNSFIGGGSRNMVVGGNSSVVGGYTNQIMGGANSSFTSIGGGANNTIGDGAAAVDNSAIGGGSNNTIISYRSYIGGGSANYINAAYSTIGGGDRDSTTGYSSSIGGGTLNKTTGGWSTIGGGFTNLSSSQASTVAGGNQNIASGTESAIGGGLSNTASGSYSTVSGGDQNIASGLNSTVSGGDQNIASATYSAVGGGSSNKASYYASTIGGGLRNSTEYSYTTIPGGYGMRLGNAAEGSFGFNGFTTYDDSAYVNAARTAYFGNVDLWLGNTRNQASQLRFYTAQSADGTFPAANTYYSAFQAGVQTGNLTYTLPIVAPTNGQVLSSTSAGVLSWANAGGLTNFTESVNTVAPNATVPVVRLLATYGPASNVDIALTPKGTGALTAQVADNTTTGGNKRGENATDWQSIRFNASEVASANYSTISGGVANTASGYISTVSGGYQNTNVGDYSAILGGRGLTFGANADHSVGYLANVSGNEMTINTANTAVFGNTNLWLANNSGTASELRFYELTGPTSGTFPPTGTNYVAFKSGVNLSTDYTYTLPTDYPTGGTGRQLTSTTSGTMSWGAQTLQVNNYNIDCGNLAANGGTAYVNVVVTGVVIGGTVTVSPRGDMEAGVIIAFARVDANDNVRVKFVNATGGAIDPAAINVDVTVVQP
ncbi:MAG: hypothetical protein IPM69_03550 [Ignavibacteria bacterium]|nr:hypothetical protein [Ignavibacteria bacterium]